MTLVFWKGRQLAKPCDLSSKSVARRNKTELSTKTYMIPFLLYSLDVITR